MANTSLTPELSALAINLASAFAQCQKVVAAKARIGLFYQNQEATDLFRKVSEYGESLREKSLAGMEPTEEEISKFDEMRRNVVANPLCAGFLEARQEIDELLATVNQYLCMAVEHGCAPTDEEVAAAMNQQMQACSCGAHHCSGDCDDCGQDCKGDCKGECKDGHHCCHEGGEGHECCHGHGGEGCHCHEH